MNVTIPDHCLVFTIDFIFTATENVLLLIVSDSSKGGPIALGKVGGNGEEKFIARHCLNYFEKQTDVECSSIPFLETLPVTLFLLPRVKMSDSNGGPKIVLSVKSHISGRSSSSPLHVHLKELKMNYTDSFTELCGFAQ